MKHKARLGTFRQSELTQTTEQLILRFERLHQSSAHRFVQRLSPVPLAPPLTRPIRSPPRSGGHHPWRVQAVPGAW
jgi:hypothetical protein